jgi:hypothetical protein
MLMVAVMALALVTVRLLGGRLGALHDLELRLKWTVPAALAVQVLVTVALSGADATLLAALHVGSYVLGGAFVVANLRVPGVPVIALGAALNVAAIVANAGVMPASPDALARAGIDHDAAHFANSAAVESARLAPLGDVFAWPAPLPLANVFSIGDVVLVLGAVILLVAVCGTRWRPAAIASPGTPA